MTERKAASVGCVLRTNAIKLRATTRALPLQKITVHVGAILYGCP